MKLRHLVAVMVAGGAVSVAQADLIQFNFPITPQQENPPNNTNAAGSGQLLFDTVTSTFDLDVQVFGIELGVITGYHIHNAPAGSNGPIVIDLVPLGNWQASGQGIRLQLNDVPIGAFQPQLFAGDLYFNLHTQQFPSGQIRGQIVPTPAGLGVLALGGLAVVRRRRAVR